MYKAKEIEGVVYRVKHLTGGWLVEVPETEDPIEALATFAAEKSVKGYIITSVTRIFDCSKDTPRMAVISTKEFKSEVKRLMDEKAYYEQAETYPETIGELTARAEAAGWSVDRDEDGEQIRLSFGQSTPAGEDFWFDACGEDVEEVVDSVKRYALDFDCDEHVREVMNGQGAPDLTTLVEDAKAIQEMLDELAGSLMRKLI